MLRAFIVFIFISLGLLAAQRAKASLLVEPVLGYSFAQNLDEENGETYSGGKGPSFGGRLGFQRLGFQLGLDYLRSRVDMNDSDFDDDLTTQEWSAFVGFKFPILLRVYGGYIFSATGETELNGQSVDLKEGSGLKLGVGSTILPFVDLNLEYRSGKFDEAEYDGVDSNLENDFHVYMLSVSLPLTFF